MKPEIYQSLAAINQATEQIVQNAEKLRDEGVLVPDFAELRVLEARQNCSDINVSAAHYLSGRELEDAGEIGKELREKRRVYSNHEATTTTTTDSGKHASGENGQRTQDGPESAEGSGTEAGS
ncbi:MAG TPA: hypothetical protein VI685_15860 [Candidatus Angelobacter sp.]